MSMKRFLKGSKFYTATCLFKSSIPLAKSPSAMWRAATLGFFLNELYNGSDPYEGGTKISLFTF